MTNSQERAITLALNVLHVGFFECPRQDYQYFINNEEWALPMSAAGVNAVAAPPQEVALAVLRSAVAKQGFFAGMTPFEPPAHYCSFLADKVRTGERKLALEPYARGQADCPYVTFDGIKESR